MTRPPQPPPHDEDTGAVQDWACAAILLAVVGVWWVVMWVMGGGR